MTDTGAMSPTRPTDAGERAEASPSHPGPTRKRSVSIAGHRTSFSIEQPFLEELQAIAEQRGTSLAALVAEVDGQRAPAVNLSSALRLHVLDWLKGRV